MSRLVGFGARSFASAASTGGTTAGRDPAASREGAAAPLSGGSVPSTRRQRHSDRRATGSGSSPDRIGDEAPADRAAPAIEARRRGSAGLGSPTRSSSTSNVPSPPIAAKRRDRLEPQNRIGLRCLNQLDERGSRARIPDPAERADGLDGDRCDRCPATSGRRCGTADAVLQRAETLRRKCARVGIGFSGKREKRRQRPRIFEALQRERDRPRSDARLAAAVEHHRRERLVRLQPDERVRAPAETPPQGVSRRSSASVAAGFASAPDSTNLRRHAARSRQPRTHRRSGPALRRRCLARAATRRERRDERIARARIADQTERKRGHLPHFGIGIGQQRDERRHAVAQADAADRQRGTPPDARFPSVSSRSRSGTEAAARDRPARPARDRRHARASGRGGSR